MFTEMQRPAGRTRPPSVPETVFDDGLAEQSGRPERSPPQE